VADTKISALTAASAALGADELPINEAGTSKKLTVAQIKTFVGLYANVKDYGAVGNDSADDTSAIAAAIAAAAGSGGAGVVYFPPGVYITSPVTIPAGITLQGANGQGFVSLVTTVPNANAKSTLKLKSGSTGPLLSPNDSGSTSCHVTVRDIALDGNAIAQKIVDLPDHGAGFMTRYWSFIRCYIYNSGQTGTNPAVYVGQNNSACVFDGCQIFNGTSGTFAGGRGLEVYGQDCMISNTWLGYFASSCLAVDGGSGETGFVMVGGGIYGSGGWGAILAGSGATFIGVSIDTNGSGGAYLANDNASFIGCLFHDNAMVNATQDNISISGTSQHVSVIGCRGPVKSPSPRDMRYFIGDWGTNTVLTAYGNMVEQTLTGFTNYAGTYTAPAFPASTVAVVNTTGADIQAFITNSSAAITAITLGATVTGMTIPISGTESIRIPYGQAIKFTYASGTPTWTWVIG
jgi:Pectate lyase superfamily protein